MACTPITSWQIDGETMETVRDFIFLDSKITSDGDCGHEIKRRLLLGRQAMTNLDSILKSRDITLLTEVYLVKALVFPVVMYRCESWTIKKNWSLKNRCFWTVLLEKTLESLLDTKEIKLSVLNEINPEYSLEGLMLKLKLQQLGHLMWRTDSLEKTDAGKDWGQEEKGKTEDEIVDVITELMDVSLSKLQETVKDREA